MTFLKNLLTFCVSRRNVDNNTAEDTMKYLIVGLGNVGEEYEGTRHNSGFMVVDRMARETEARWSLERHAYRTEVRHKGRTLVLVKPTTYMNLSGKAVNYWLQAEKIAVGQLMVVVDDIALPVGTLRMKQGGSAGGHNGLADIERSLGSAAYARLRVGVGDNFSRGGQVNYVLGRFKDDELAALEPALDRAVEGIRIFATQGIERAMNYTNTKQEGRAKN